MTCKPIAAALACLIAAAPAFAEPIRYVFQPKTGTVWTVTETRTRSTTQAGKPPLIMATTSGRLVVVGKTDKGYTMEWTVESVSANGVTLTEDDGLTQFFIGVPVRFDSDAGGSPVLIHNGDALVESAIATLSTTVADIDKPAVMTLVRQVLKTPEMMISTLLPQAALMGNCQGFTLEPGETKKFASQSPNVLGGPPIPATTTVLLEDKGSATTPALIRIVESYDAEAATIAIMESLKMILAQRNLPPPDPNEKLPALSRVADMACQINVSTGETSKVVLDMKVDAGAMMQKRDLRNIVIARRN